ncbi:unnamed protein product [Prunus armeniaca]|uniref:Uncharacterized protein n=1 Tax=Prunus armeniaca TaxID=36596 RepID=A0A6J5VZ08_PRUAR|nr:unnamed protein product [Prunus armeniaca]
MAIMSDLGCVYPPRYGLDKGRGAGFVDSGEGGLGCYKVVFVILKIMAGDGDEVMPATRREF